MFSLEELCDRESIRDALVAYSQGIDQRNWELFDQAWTDDATFEAPGEHVTSPVLIPLLKERMQAGGMKNRLTGQHLLHNTWFDIRGHEAHVLTEVVWLMLETTDDPHTLLETSGTGLYSDDFVRTAKGWRIKARFLAVKSKLTQSIRYDEKLLVNLKLTKEHLWHEPKAVNLTNSITA